MKARQVFHFFTGALLIACAWSDPGLAGVDPGRGQLLFKQKCSACHSATQGAAATMGPNLYGVVNRKAGATAFSYSPALKASGLIWRVQALDGYLKAPRTMVPGTRMVIATPNATDRADLVAYLAAQGGNH